jgi:hypothetical protein
MLQCIQKVRRALPGTQRPTKSPLFQNGGQSEGSAERRTCPGNQNMPPTSHHLPSAGSSTLQQVSPPFLTIPLEIRRKVYEYLLSDQYLLGYTKWLLPYTIKLCMEIKYETALFTVCKKISDEALEFFYTKNAFVAIECNMGDFLRECKEAIPLVIREDSEVRDLSNCALKIDYISEFAGFNAPRRKMAYAVFPGRHLATFLQLLNTELWRYSKAPLASLVFDIEFRTNRGYYKGNVSVTSSLMESLKLTRKPKDLAGNVSVTSSLMERLKLTRKSKYLAGKSVVKIYGDITAEQIKNILVAMPSSDMDVGEAIELMGKAKQRGDDFLQAGDYNAARAEYVIAIKGISILMAKRDISYENAFSANFSLYLSTSILDSKQGHYASAISNAKAALRSMVPMSRYSLGQRANCQIRLGEACAENGQYGNASRAFEQALVFQPGCSTTKEKLDAANVVILDSINTTIESSFHIFEGTN